MSYHYGAGNTDELKNLFRKSLVLTGMVAIMMTAAAMILSSPLARLFVGYDAELMAMTAIGMKLYSLSFLLCGFNIFGSSFFTALNNGPLSACISGLRTLVFEVAAILILPIFLKITGIWLAIVVAEGLTLIITIGFLIKNKTRYHYA